MRDKRDNKQSFRPGVITGVVAGLSSSIATWINLCEMGYHVSKPRVVGVFLASLSFGSALGGAVDYGLYRRKNTLLNRKNEDFTENSQSNPKIENKSKYPPQFKPSIATGIGLSSGFVLGVLGSIPYPSGLGHHNHKSDIFLTMLAFLVSGTTIGLGLDYGKHRLFRPCDCNCHLQPIEEKTDELMQFTTIRK